MIYLKNKIIDIAEWLIGGNIAIIYSRLYDYTKTTVNVGCPFCKESDDNVILRFSRFHIRRNIYPYSRVKDHLLLCPNEHITSWYDIQNKEEFLEIEQKYLDIGYISLKRQYPHGGASVDHCHLHLIKM